MPNRAALGLRMFAQRLVSREAGAVKPGDAHTSAAFHVCEKLRNPLSRLAGVAGFRSLLSRALALACDETQWLKAVNVKADGSLEGLDEAQALVSQSEAAEGEVMLVAEFMGLLVTFIGEALTVQLMQEAWPEARFQFFGEENS